MKHYPKLEAARNLLIAEVMEAFRLQRDDIPDSALDNEQPVSLWLGTSLGTLRKVRMLVNAQTAMKRSVTESAGGCAADGSGPQTAQAAVADAGSSPVIRRRSRSKGNHS